MAYKPPGRSNKPASRIQPEHLAYINSLEPERMLAAKVAIADKFLILLDIVADMENFYFTVGTRFDKTAFKLNLKDNTPDPETNIVRKPDEVFFTSAKGFVSGLQEVFERWEEEAKEAQEREEHPENYEPF